MGETTAISAPGEHTRTSASFHELYEAHAASALRLALVLTGNRSAAEDLVQDAFVRLISRFQDRRHPESFERYLRTTIINLARSRWRSASRRLRGREQADSPDHAEGVALGEALWQEILRLPPRQRAALFLRYFEDRRHSEVAACLGCSVPAVKSLLHSAIKTLRTRTGGEHYE